MRSSRYCIPAQSVELVTEVKRSRFVAQIAHSSNADEAFTIIEQAKKQHPDARHHCWAFIACPPLSASAVRFSDAGEPSGTAGKPILNVLQYSQYGEITCVVSRYFGGVKLGAGGLVRAYSNSVRSALEILPTKETIARLKLSMQFPYPYESSIRHYLEQQQINISEVHYREQVIFQIAIEQQLIPELTQYVRNLCKGQVKLFDADTLIDISPTCD